ncbi:MAG: FtsK/SpoIIIE domain-containing protein [Pseudolysinimonas sp.]
MIPNATLERLALPALSPPPPRAAFPFVATAAPVVLSLGIWAVTGSVYSLLFAALGPVVAVGSLLDGRRQRRRQARRDTARAVAALGRARERVLVLHDRERTRLGRLAPPLEELCQPSSVATNWAQAMADSDSTNTGPFPVRLGHADRPAVVALDGGVADTDDELSIVVRAAVDDVRRTAAELPDAPWLVDARDGVGVVGPMPAARALARSIVLQLAMRSSPLTTRIIATSDEEWITALPHAVTVESGEQRGDTFRLSGNGPDLLVAWAASESELPPGLNTVVGLAPADDESADRAGSRRARFDLLGVARAGEAAHALAALAAERGLLAGSRRLPDAVLLAELLSIGGLTIESDVAANTPHRVAPVGLRAPIGRDATGVVELDLVRDGPHAVVAGTTGAGKSELLVSWVLAMAARHPPSAVTFLLVDFKGGAAFAPLAGLPHVIGTVSDLDARRSARAIESLRAELQRRERVLAEHGMRSIDDWESEARSGQRSARSAGVSGLARLVIVVDEFAAVVSGQPELHELFADLSARGRSLGLHLILCTQRPSGVVRDAVLANVTLRISLRVTDRGDSIAMLGSDAATRLPQEPRGRALVADGGGTIREVQLALAEPGDAQRLLTGPAPSATMWCDPLAELLPLAPLLVEAGADGSPGVPFGRVDLPAEQRQPIAWYDPRGDGHLLVLGAARSGRSETLRTLAAGANTAGVGCIVIPHDPAEAWSTLTWLLTSPEPETGGVVLLDDLDLLLARVDPDERHELLELLTRLARSTRRRGLVVSAQRLTGGLQTLAGLFDARILLRQSSRDEHVLSGGDGAAFDPRLPAGAGRWTGGRGGGAAIQVAIGGGALPAAELVELPTIRPEAGRPLGVVCPRPREFEKRWAGTGNKIIVLGEHPAPDDQELRGARGATPILLLGDPDAWQAEWELLALVRRELPVVVVGCAPVDLRAVTRAREAAPPLGNRPGECWWVEAGVVRRALLDVPPFGGSLPAT